MKADKIFLAKKPAFMFYPVILIAFFILCSCSLSQVKMNPLPPPLPTAKLRIHVVAVTSNIPPEGFWRVSQEKYAEDMARQTGRMLNNRGIYEVVPDSDVKLVLGDQKVAAWEWMSNHWALAQKVGKALHADYVLCIERTFKLNIQHTMFLINLHTGKEFSVSNDIPKKWFRDDRTAFETIMINYRTLFRSAQSDLLRTALGKDRVPGKEPKAHIPSAETEPVPGQPPTDSAAQDAGIIKTKAKPQEERLTAEERQLAFEKEMEASLSSKDVKKDGSRLVIYDFDAAENLRIVGMILTEALREEMYKLGGFVLINRENMAQVMEELKLQQSGLVNEKQAVKLGEWMAANQAVTGNFAIVGKASILQAKRIDIKTLGTISLGSLKCKTGEEDDLLGSMPELARKLTQEKQP